MRGASSFKVFGLLLLVTLHTGALASDGVESDGSCHSSAAPTERRVRDVLASKDDDGLSLLQKNVQAPFRPTKITLPSLAEVWSGRVESGPLKFFAPVKTKGQFDRVSQSPYDDDNYLSNPMNDELIDRWYPIDMFMLCFFGITLITVDITMMFSSKPATLGGHVKMLGIMFIFSALYGCGVFYTHDRAYATAWTSGYILEWALSLDNLFVFHMIFTSFAVPDAQAEFALTVGIYGAMLLRIVFLIGLEAIFEIGYTVDVVVGIVLVISGFLTLTDDEDDDVQDLYTVRIFKWLCRDRLETSYDPRGSLFTKGKSGEHRITLLFLVICIVCLADLFFAVDSMGSKTGQIKNAYVNISSSLMAMFSLRAAFFVIRDMSHYFELLKYGIAGILMFVGLEMVVSKWVNLSLAVVCLVISFLFCSSLAASFIRHRCYSLGDEDEEEEYAPEDTCDVIKKLPQEKSGLQTKGEKKLGTDQQYSPEAMQPSKGEEAAA